MGGSGSCRYLDFVCFSSKIPFIYFFVIYTCTFLLKLMFLPFLLLS